MWPKGHQRVSKWHLKPFLRHQIAVSLTKVKSFKNRWFYYGLNTSSLSILASSPSLDHQKDRPWNCFPLWHPKSQKSRNCTQSGSQEAPKMHPKIDKNWHLALSVSIGCPPGSIITKMVPQVPKINLEGLQNDGFRYKKQSFQQPTSQQLPASKGAGGRGEALKQ